MAQIYYCEMCGSPIKGRPRDVVIEGAYLKVCESCYRRVIERDRLPSRQLISQAPGSPRPTGHQSKSPLISAQRKRGKPERVELEVVDDYNIIVRMARERLGWTTQALANRVMESENVIKRIEQGKLIPTLGLARKLERALGIKLVQPVAEEDRGSVMEVPREGATLGELANIKMKKGESKRL